MHAWFCDNPIGVEALQWREAPTPQPGPGEIRVAVRAASLNFPDLLIVQNKYQIKPPVPFVPGSEYAGVVDELGPGVTGLSVGDRVAALGGTGGFGTHAIVPAERVMPVPVGFDFEHAAAFMFTYGTSWHALMDRGALQPGETVLVLGAAGGVGSSAVQIAKAAGARVIGAASTDEKCALARSLGAEATINYRTEDIRDALKKLTDGKGPDVVYDPVGGDLAEPVLRSVAWRGRYLVIGFASGTIPSVPLNLPLLKGVSIVGVFWGQYVQREPRANAAMLVRLSQWAAEGKVKPAIDRALPMSELHAAYARMNNREVLGKVVLVNA